MQELKRLLQAQNEQSRVREESVARKYETNKSIVLALERRLLDLETNREAQDQPARDDRK